MFNEQKKKALKIQQPIYPYFDSKNLKKKSDYLYTELDPYYVEENLYSDEDFRYEIVKNQLEDLSTRREEISDDSDKTDSEK